jgi:uncharacterized protein (TIGR02145 family)
MGSNWANTLSGAYGIYGNSQSNDLIFGKLYNHFAVLDPRGLCPTNWHVPTDGEWTTLVNNVGGNGGALKSTNLWNSPNSGANNSSGFTGLPGGFVPWDGGHAGLYEMAIWWSSTTYSSNRAWFRALMSYNNVVEHFENLRTQGCSVRCLKD